MARSSYVPSAATTTTTASRRNDAEKLEAFNRYTERSAPYFTAGAPEWFSDETERREMFDRRYHRPAAPYGMKPVQSITAPVGWE